MHTVPVLSPCRCMDACRCVSWLHAVFKPCLCAGCTVFDVFKTWRLDSGSYSQMAEIVVSAWEKRCKQLDQSHGPQGIPRQRPALMHSNLSDVSECLEVAK